MDCTCQSARHCSRLSHHDKGVLAGARPCRLHLGRSRSWQSYLRLGDAPWMLPVRAWESDSVDAFFKVQGFRKGTWHRLRAQ